MLAMPIKYIYKKQVVGIGTLMQIPRVGDFIEIEFGLAIFKVEAIMFRTLINHSVEVMIYLADIMSETEQKLRDYKES